MMHRNVIVPLVLALLGVLPAMPAAAQSTSSADPPSGQSPQDGNPPAEDWAGHWYTDFGFVDLDVDGHEVTGTYSCCHGKIEGAVRGTQIEFSWKDPIYGEGWGYWYWQDQGARLRGIFGKMEDFGTGGAWNAVRLPEPDVGEDPVRFGVRAEHPRHGTLRGEVVLSGLEGADIRGTLRGAYDLEARGKPFKYEMWNVLSGHRDGDAVVLEWLDPLYETLGDLRVTRAQVGSWLGTWQPHFTDGDAERREIRLLAPQE